MKCTFIFLSAAVDNPRHCWKYWKSRDGEIKRDLWLDAQADTSDRNGKTKSRG